MSSRKRRLNTSVKLILNKMDHKLHKAHILEYQPKNTLSLLQTSSLVYILSRSWWDYWCKHVGYHDKYTEVSPGPIDN